MDVVVEFVEIALFGCGLIAWARLVVGGWDVGFAAACSCSLGGVAHSEVVLFVCVFYCFGYHFIDIYIIIARELKTGHWAIETRYQQKRHNDTRTKSHIIQSKHPIANSVGQRVWTAHRIEMYTTCIFGILVFNRILNINIV